MEQEITLVPTKEARQLYSKMVARADDEHMHLDLEATLKLSVDRVESGHRLDHQLVRELEDEGWLEPSDDGGWYLC